MLQENLIKIEDITWFQMKVFIREDNVHSMQQPERESWLKAKFEKTLSLNWLILFNNSSLFVPDVLSAFFVAQSPDGILFNNQETYAKAEYIHNSKCFTEYTFFNFLNRTHQEKIKTKYVFPYPYNKQPIFSHKNIINVTEKISKINLKENNQTFFNPEPKNTKMEKYIPIMAAREYKESYNENNYDIRTLTSPEYIEIYTWLELKDILIKNALFDMDKNSRKKWLQKYAKSIPWRWLNLFNDAELFSIDILSAYWVIRKDVGVNNEIFYEAEDLFKRENITEEECYVIFTKSTPEKHMALPFTSQEINQATFSQTQYKHTNEPPTIEEEIKFYANNNYDILNIIGHIQNEAEKEMRFRYLSLIVTQLKLENIQKLQIEDYIQAFFLESNAINASQKLLVLCGKSNTPWDDTKNYRDFVENFISPHLEASKAALILLANTNYLLKEHTCKLLVNLKLQANFLDMVIDISNASKENYSNFESYILAWHIAKAFPGFNKPNSHNEIYWYKDLLDQVINQSLLYLNSQTTDQNTINLDKYINKEQVIFHEKALIYALYTYISKLPLEHIVNLSTTIDTDFSSMTEIEPMIFDEKNEDIYNKYDYQSTEMEVDENTDDHEKDSLSL